MKELRELRCSSLHRFMNCVGHLSLSTHEPNEAGDAAKEGTAIGEYLTAMIHQKTDKPNFGVAASNDVFINDEMKFHAGNTYRALVESANGAVIESEERIDWMADSTTIRGQFDISYYTGGEMKDGYLQGVTLHVEDLKYGYGIVEVEENWQLLGYAIGQHMNLLSKGIYVGNIVLRIHQPRAYHEQGTVRTWTISKEQLMAYYYSIINQVRRFVSGDKTLTTSNSCKYCDAAAHCPALNRAFHNSLDVILDDYTEKELTNDDLSHLLDMVDRANEIVKIKHTSLKNLAISKLMNNQIVPSYGMVQKYGDRRWKDGVDATTIKMMTGIDVTKTDIMSPAQAEKAGVNKKLVEQLAIKPSKGFELGRVDINKKADKLFK